MSAPAKASPAPTSLAIEQAEIPRPPGGKFQNFTSDFAPPPEPFADGARPS
jgi:hypothetical protein